MFSTSSMPIESERDLPFVKKRYAVHLKAIDELSVLFLIITFIEHALEQGQRSGTHGDYN